MLSLSYLKNHSVIEMEKKHTYEELEQRIRDLERGKSAEKGLCSPEEDQESMYRLILESISDAVIVTDDQGNMLYVCPNTTFIFGLSQDQVYNQQTIQRLMNGTVCDISELKDQHEIKGVEWSITNSYGKTRCLLIDAKSVSINGGTVLYVMHDITDRKDAEEALKESEKKFRGLIERQNDVLYRMSLPDGAYEYVSPAASRVFGYSSKEFFDNPFLIRDIIHPGYIDYFEKEWLALAEGKVPPISEYKIIGPEGNDRWIVQSNIGVFDHQGNIIAIEGICRDVTERKHAEKALRESEEKYRGVVENANEGITVTQDGMLKFVNRKGLEISGYSKAEMLSRPFIEIVHPDDRQAVMQHHLKRLKGEEIPEVYVLRFIAKDGAMKWLENNGVVITWEGKPATLNLLTDITKRKQAEEALKISRENLLEEYNQRKILSKRLIDLLEKDRHEIAMELHDNIGQILTSLKIYLELIDDKLKPIDAGLGSFTKAAIKRANQAINDLNNIAHGLMPGILDALGLVPSLRSLLNEFRELTDIKIDFFNRNVQKRFDKEKELAIYRIVQEALNNIVKHAEAKNVYVSLLKKGNVLSLSVEDNGVGFDQDKAMKISKGKGPLGLVIMRERAMQLDGELTIESLLGKGTHILAEIPI